MKIAVKSLEELNALAKKLSKNLSGGTVLALVGELGAGKTTFSKFFLHSAGINKTITSPTFVLMNRYAKGKKFYYHLDLYRTKNFAEIEALGVPEEWQRDENIFLIEWADKIRRQLPKNTITLKFKVAKNHRQIEILNLPAKIAKILS